MPTRNKQTKNAPKRKSHNKGAQRHMGRRTVRSSNRTRAQRAGESDKVLPGKRGKSQGSPAIDEQNEEVYGVLLSERRRMGDNTPAVPEKTKNTQSIEAKRTPRTGVAKGRRNK
jgi:hypothetical protein